MEPTRADDLGPGGAPPDPPTDLRAASLDRAVSLDWDPPPSGSGVVTYAVHRHLLGSTPGEKAVATETLLTQTVDSRYLDEGGLLNDRTYAYTVRATSATGALSAPARVTVTPREPVPGQPQRAPVLRGRFLDSGDMQLDWTPPSTPVDAFVLHRRTLSQGEQYSADGTTIVHAGRDLSHLDDHPYDTAESYGFAVQTQVNGVLGPLSEEVQLVRPRGFPPTDPITLQAEPTLQQTVRLSWNTVEYGKEYLLYREDAPGSGTFSLLTTRTTPTLEAAGDMTYEDRRVPPLQRYRYYVLCYGNQVGGRVQSEDVTAVALPRQSGAPPAPAVSPKPEAQRLVQGARPLAHQMVLHATPGIDEVVVRWNPVPGAVGYEIQGGPVLGPDGLPSRERYTILVDDVVTHSYRHRRTDDVPWEYFGFWLSPQGLEGRPTKYQARNLAYGTRANSGAVGRAQADALGVGAVPVPDRVRDRVRRADRD